MAGAPQFMANAPPAPLRTWRCKVGPRRLAELDAQGAMAGTAGATSRSSGLSSSTPPPVDPAARSKTVRLSRLNPGLMRRLEDVRLSEEEPSAGGVGGGTGSHPWGRSSPSTTMPVPRGATSSMPLGVSAAMTHHQHRGGSDRCSPPLGMAPFMPGSALPLVGDVDVPAMPVPRKWSMSLPAARRPSLPRRARGSAAVPPLEVQEKKRLMDTYGLQASPTDQQRGGDDGPGEEQDHLARELEALRRHCADLEDALRRARGGGGGCGGHRSGRPPLWSEPGHSGTSSPLPGPEALRAAGVTSASPNAAAMPETFFEDEVERLRTELKAAMEREESAVAHAVRHTSELEERQRAFATELADCEAQQKAADAKVFAAEAAEAEANRRAAAAVARLEVQAEKQAELEEVHRRAAQAARTNALAMGAARVELADRGARLAIFSAWRGVVTEERLRNEAQAQSELRVEAETSEAAAESGRRLAVRRAGLAEAAAADEASRLRARATAAEARLSCAEALHEAAAEEAERLRQKMEEKAQESERRSSAIAAEQEARHRAELQSLAAAKEKELEDSLLKQADKTEERLQVEVQRSVHELRGLATEMAEKLWQERCAKGCCGGAGAVMREAAAKLRRSRALHGTATLVGARDHATLTAIVTAWRCAVDVKKAGSAQQTKLFSEQAGRAAALRAQKLDLDTRYMDAKDRHRADLRRLRTELAEAETRHADAIAAQEAEAAQKLAAAEADFSQALRDAAAAGTSSDSATQSGKKEEEEDQKQGEDGQAPAANVDNDSGDDDEEDDAAGSGADGEARARSAARRRQRRLARQLLSGIGSEASDSSGVGGAAAAVAEARVTEVLRSLRARAEQRLTEAEAKHAEALLTERERADLKLAREERRHEEAIRVARESAERRLAAADAKHAEALRNAQDAAESRLMEAEAQIAQLKSLLEVGGVSPTTVSTADESGGDDNSSAATV